MNDDLRADRPYWNYGDLAQTVASDLSKVMGDGPAREEPLLIRRPLGERVRGGERLAKVAMVVAAGLVVAAGGLWAGRQAARGTEPEPVTAPVAQEVAMAVPLPPTAYNFLMSPSPPQATPAPVPVVERTPVVEPRPAEPEARHQARQPAKPLVRPRPEVLPDGERDFPIQDRSELADRNSRPSYSEVLAAERELRRAYDRAIDAGVPREVLADYRARWAQVNRRQAGNPWRMVQRYSELSEQLERQARYSRG